MKTSILGSLLLAAVLTSAADGPVFETSFPKFQLSNAPIVWAVPASNRPTSLWVYKVIPQTFPPEAISNLMARGSLTLQDRCPGPLYRLISKDLRRYLLLDPSQGRVEFGNEEATASMSDKKTHRPAPVEGVPADAEVEVLGLNLLKQFGIHRSDLVTKPGTTHLLTFGEKRMRSYLDKARGVPVENEVDERGIFFNRCIDGIGFAGIGVGAGCEVAFGNHAKISRFNLVWRNLQPYERRRVATPEEMERWIREGKAVMTHRDYVNPKEVEKLTIREIAPLYLGADARAHQDFVYPFAQLEATADLGRTNSPVQLYCPILSSDIVSAAKEESVKH